MRYVYIHIYLSRYLLRTYYSRLHHTHNHKEDIFKSHLKWLALQVVLTKAMGREPEQCLCCFFGFFFAWAAVKTSRGIAMISEKGGGGGIHQFLLEQ